MKRAEGGKAGQIGIWSNPKLPDNLVRSHLRSDFSGYLDLCLARLSNLQEQMEEVTPKNVERPEEINEMVIKANKVYFINTIII